MPYEQQYELSIIIVNYNVKELLIKCLQSIYQHHDDIVLEIIVVDNDSKDGSISAVKEHFPDVQIIPNNFNNGFSGANNQGINISRGKYIFLLNPDTEILDNALIRLKNYMDSNSQCAILAPQLLNSDGSIQISVWKNHGVIDLVIETFYLHKFFNTINYPISYLKNTFNAKTLSGAALFFKKSLIDSIGALDEHFFWMEDIDFCYRAQLFGAITYLPNAKIIHHSGHSQKKNYNVAICNQLISKLKYYRKYSNMFSVFIAHLSCLVFILTRNLAFAILMPFNEQYHLKSKAYFYTLKKYYKYLFLDNNSLT